MFRWLGRGLALVRAAFGAPLVAGKVSTGATDFGGAPGVVGSGWVTVQWWGNDAIIIPNPTSNQIEDLSRASCGLDTNLILGS
jgi:hypothetical protein